MSDYYGGSSVPSLTADEAAEIDGAGFAVTFRQIILPANERTQGWYGVVEGLIKISGPASWR